MKVTFLSPKIAISLVVMVLMLAGCLPVVRLWLPKASALTPVSVQSGYYMGDGSSGHAITGLGFAPEFVLVKADTTAGVAVFKTNQMPSNNMAFMSAVADNTGSNLVLDADGFTVGAHASVNNSQVRYTWVAFAGSDCTSNGVMCINSYTGDGTFSQSVSTGFQPDFVMNKRTTAVAAHFHTASQPNNETLFFINAVRHTAGSYIQSFGSSSFSVGSSDNGSGSTYNFVAFQNSANIFHEGSYGGNSTDDRSVTGAGFAPSIAFVKNASNSTANNTYGVMNTGPSYGDNSTFLTATANGTNHIQALQSDGIQVGTSVYVNSVGDTYYWLAFGGAPPAAATPDTHFGMTTGSYTGSGTAQSITGIGFQPDLVMIKDESANYQVFRTSLMRGDLTSYFSNTPTNFTGGITSINSTGFSVGTNANVNTSGNTYHWQAFSGAWNPETNAGSTDFAIGVYTGNGTDNRSITGMPWQPDMVTVRKNGIDPGVWRSSAHSGDASSYFHSLTDATDFIQALNSDGFEIGLGSTVNTANTLYYWFAFKNSSGFAAGSYTGNGADNRNITSVGFQSDLVWVKRSTAFPGVSRPSDLTGDSTQFFRNDANAADYIQAITSTGFQVGANNSINAGGGTYRYVAWRDVPPTVISLTITSDGVVSYGTVAAGTSRSTIDVSDTQTVANDGNVAEDINIKTDEPAGWALGSSAGVDIFAHEFSTTSGSSWTLFTAANSYQALITNMAASDTQNFDLRLTMPTQSTSDTQKSITVTLQAVQH